jgi:hypothetical protein
MDFSVTLFFDSLKNSQQGKDNNRRKSSATAFNNITGGIVSICRFYRVGNGILSGFV